MTMEGSRAVASLAPLPVRTNLDGSHGFAVRDVRMALEQNFEPAGPLI